MRRMILCLVLFLALSVTGCGGGNLSSKKESQIDYTVVTDEDLPVELVKLIDEKKETTMRMTYTTKDYTYVVDGFGNRPTSGYSIKVNDVYLSSNSVCVDVELVGPQADEEVCEITTTPYIVLKMEKRDEAVVFCET